MRTDGRVNGRSFAQAAGVLALAIMSAMGFSAPTWAQEGCAWYGTRPFCNGQCPGDMVYTGARVSCTTGSRRYCCPRKHLTSGINCKWVGRPGSMLHVCDDPQSPWAAVAINDAGGWGASIQSRGKAVAVQDALARCGGSKCRIATQGRGRCVAVATSKVGGVWFGYAHGDDLNVVRGIAMKGCTDRASEGCQLAHENCLR